MAFFILHILQLNLTVRALKKPAIKRKHRTMINHNTTYEAGTPELASGFLLMPCYNQWGLQAEMFIRSTKKNKEKFLGRQF